MIPKSFQKGGLDTPNWKILRAALIVGSLSLVAKFAATLKEVIVARSFGRGDEVDAFLIAFVLPSFVLSIGMTALGSALVPVFVEARQRDSLQGAHRLLANIMFFGTLALVAIVALMGLLAPFYLPLLGHSFSPKKLELTYQLLYLLLPWIIFSGIATLAAAVLNAEEKFALPALTPLVSSFIIMGFVLLAAHRWGVFTLALGTVVGSFLESVLLLYALRKQGLRFTLHWHGLDPRIRNVLAQYAPLLASGIIMGSTPIVDQAMAATLPAGSVAALGYANKVISSIVSLGSLAISTPILPYFSRMCMARDWAACRHTLKRYSVLVVSVTVPFMLLLMTFSRPIIKLLYQRGAFTAADTELVSRVQVFYALQIPFYVWSMVFVRFISAARRNDVLMYIAVVNLALDVTLNLLFMRIWHVAGIALSTSIVYIACLLLTSIWSVRFLARESLYSASAVQAETTH
jgi:putative peptidoglycan lipid II flippase